MKVTKKEIAKSLMKEIKRVNVNLWLSSTLYIVLIVISSCITAFICNQNEEILFALILLISTLSFIFGIRLLYRLTEKKKLEQLLITINL